MKKIIICIIAFVLVIPCVLAQSEPQGMKYQAIARDLKGEIMGDQPIELRMTLRGNDNIAMDYYVETHQVSTNKFGLFSLVIGNGDIQSGTFKEIPWSEENIWVTIEIKNQENNAFSVISNSKLLAVPYAFHATTASNLAESALNRPRTDGVPSQNWSLFGNRNSSPKNDKLGTTDEADLVIVTNNLERLRIKANGDIITGDGRFTIGGNLEVEGDSTIINNDLYVGRNVHLNNNDEFEPRGETINYGNFTVENESATLLTGTLDVQGDTFLEAKLHVVDSTYLEAALDVQGNTYLEAALDVQGDTYLGAKLHVVDSTYLEANLTVVANVQDGGYLATFENINEGNGDGVNIKLGKTHPGWSGSAYINATNPVAEYFDVNIANVRNAVTGAEEFTFGDALSLIPATLIAGTACGLLEQLVVELNGALDLPLGSRDIAVVVNGCDPYILANGSFTTSGEPTGPCHDNDDPFTNFAFWHDDWVPPPGGGIELIPEFETDFCGDLPMLSMPNIDFVNVSNSLTNNNHFIEFSDKEDRSLGSVRAVSITEWGNNYFDGVWLSGFVQKSVGLDPLDVVTGLVNVGTQIVDDYNKIGVEYTSGNGDYAEWLERLDPNEFISKGDIVGVIGGKITKDLENAEQIMAVSEQPIMLGNIPEKSKENLGNNIAFMGQIPVKVIGEVHSGDYIIADTKVPGYGIAKNPSEVTIEDTKFIVGRSWETNVTPGPKMVNTVIGVHNGDYLKIIKKFHTEFKKAEKRLDNLESKVDELINNSAIIDSSLND